MMLLVNNTVNHQMCIRSQAVIDSCLTFVNAVELVRS
jgi:hypothetical protein